MRERGLFKRPTRGLSKKNPHKTTVSEPPGCSVHADTLPPWAVVCCLLQTETPKQTEEYLHCSQVSGFPVQPNPTEASGMGKPSDLFLGEVVSSLLLSLTQLRSFFSFFWWGRIGVMTQTQISCCSQSEAPLARRTQDESSVFANRVDSAESYFRAMKSFSV